MRKFIVRHFALDYFTKCFGKTINFTRSATFIYPLFALNAIISLMVDGFEPFMIATLIPLALALFFGFVYFRIKPVKFEELDLVQIWQYEQAIKKSVIFEEITEEMMHKFIEANNYVENLVDNKDVKFYKPLLWIFHPAIITLVTLGITLLLVK